MNNKSTFFFVLLSIVLFSSFINAQVLFTEDFSETAGNLVGQNGWTGQASGLGVTPIQVVAGNLTYAGYQNGVGVGNKLQFGTSGEDDFRLLGTTVTSGSVYASFLVNVSAVQAGGDYFIHFCDGGSSLYVARTAIRLSTTNVFDFGIEKYSGGGAYLYSTTPFALNTTYLVVIKYQFNTGSATDDIVSLFVNPDLSGAEPAPLLSNSVGNDITTNISSINLRQGSSTAAPTVQIDGLIVSQSWAGILPVELTSFTASVSNNVVNLRWATATELNNTGFQVERSAENSGWTKIGYVSGNGNSNSNKSYSYTDNTISKSGKYNYRLKQIDVNGSYKYYTASEVNFVAPSVFTLNQNYPNPFNPSTIISYSIPNASNVKLLVYNAIGQVVSVLENGSKEAGIYNVSFNASDLPSGLYFYQIEAGQFSQTRKMMLVK
jgi:hypothetical protein